MGKKKSTPAELDYLFERDIIEEDDYREFWSEYWERETPEERQEWIDEWMDEYIEEEEDEITSGQPTKNRDRAEEEAARIGGYVVRRNAAGQFSKNGHTFQAVARRK